MSQRGFSQEGVSMKDHTPKSMRWGTTCLGLACAVLVCSLGLLAVTPVVAADATTTTTGSMAVTATGCDNAESYFRQAFSDSANLTAAQLDAITASSRSMDIKKSYCIGNLLKWMDWSSLQNMLMGIIKQVILDMVNQVFNYVCSEAQSLVSSVLSKLCIPRPSFGAINLGLTADGLETCNGISLAQLKSATGSVIVPLTTESNQAINKYFTNLQTKTK